MADRTILEFATILGVNVHMDNDYIPIVNAAGATLTDKNRKITPRQFLGLVMAVSGIFSFLEDEVTLPTTSGAASFPLAASGTGEAGLKLKGNTFIVAAPGGYIPGVDEPQFCPTGTWLTVTEDDPGNDPTKWRQL